MLSSPAGCFEEAVDLEATVAEVGCKEVVGAQRDFCASIRRK